MELQEVNYEVELPKEAIRPFEEKILASGLCDFIVPMSFLHYKDKSIIKYHCSGYVSVRHLDMDGIKDVMEVVEKTLITLSKAEEFMIRPERITLNTDTAYYNLKRKDVKIAYMPADPDSGTLTEKVSDYIDGLGHAAGSEKRYLSGLQETMRSENLSLKALADHVGEIRREIFLCGI